MVFSYRCFGTHEMEPVGYLETSEANYQYTLRIIEKEQIFKYRFYS
jgi:hypothetical protein